MGWALQELAIEPIFALSPQAKGRIERLFGTLQDRLIAELEKAGIRDMDSANEFLQARFLQAFNTQFGRPASEAQKAWRPCSAAVDLERICSFRYEATVGNDNAVRLGGLLLEIPPGPYRTGYAKARVEVRQLLDGSWRIYYHDRLIAQHPPTELREPLKTLRRRKKNAKASVPYHWVYQASAPQHPP